MKINNRLPLICLGAFIAGITNGLLGAGGGIVLIFLLSPALSGIYEKNGYEFYKSKDVMAISLSVMLPISVVSAIRYGARGLLDLSYVSKIIFPSVLGGFAGGILLNKLQENLITKIFAFLVIYSGLAMILR